MDWRAVRLSTNRATTGFRVPVCAAGEASAFVPPPRLLPAPQVSPTPEKVRAGRGISQSISSGMMPASLPERRTTQAQNRAAAFQWSVAREPSSAPLRTFARGHLPSCFPLPTTRGIYPPGAGLAPPESAPHQKYPHRERLLAAACETKPSLAGHQLQASTGSTGKRLE